jgi:hypothetical protein
MARTQSPRLEADPRPGAGPVPEANRPGHHPEHEQDKPDLDAFAERFRHVPAGEPADRTEEQEAGSARTTTRMIVIGAALAGAVALLVLARTRRRS